MAETVPFKYRAFLSYSHRDTAWAQWLHSRLEEFRIDNDLIGRQTPLGPVPKTLRPIFRDRDDFSGGHTLTEETVTAIDESAALIVLCSTVSAGRPAVNEEVRLFRSRHPDRLVIPVLIDGTWPDNFPPALRYELAADGTVTNRPVTILGPDLRESADGKNLGLAKTVAGLTGLAPDDIFRRAERERRKQARLRTAVAALIVLLALVGGGFYWQSYQQKQTLAEISALVDKYSLVTPARAAAPGAKQSLTEAITTIAEGAATDPRYAQALALLKAGKPEEAEPLLKAVAEDKEKRAGKEATDAAAAYRNLASIAAVSDPGRARDYYERAARLDPSNIEGMYQNGWFHEQAGQLDAARAAYGRVIAAARPGVDDDDLVRAKFGIGDIEQQRGDLSAALATYQEAETIVDRLAKSDPGNDPWQHDLSVLHNNVGDVQVAQGHLHEALASYQASLAIAERLAKSDPGNAGWQRDLSWSYERVGDVQVAQGHLPEALAPFQESLAIVERLAKSDPGNAGWQRDLSVSYNKVGDVQEAQGHLPEALASYQAGLAIRERLAKSDLGNVGWQRDLSVSYNKVGDVQEAQGHLPEALASYQAGLAIRERLAKSDPGNAGWQFDLDISNERIGDVQMAQGDLTAALKSYEAKRDIISRLAKSDPGNAGWQRDLSVSYERVGDVQEAQGHLPEALASCQASLAIRERLAKSDPGNAGWQRDLSVSYNEVGDVQVAQGHLPEALASYQADLAIIERLAKSDPGNAGWQRDLAVSYSKLGDVFVKQGKGEDAVQNYHLALSVMERLTAADTTNMLWQADVIEYNYDLAINDDNSADRFVYVAASLKKLKSIRELSAEEARWLAQAEMQLGKLRSP